MCKIDAAYAAMSLDEKIDPLERFEQALDEFAVAGIFRDLLLKHFSANWREALGNIETIEKVLNAVSPSANDLDKLISFIEIDAISSKLESAMWYITEDISATHRYPLFTFIVDAARDFSRSSPFDLYESNLARAMGVSKEKLLEFAFGKDYISDNFFNAEVLTGLHPDERIEKLWRFFYETTKSVNNFATKASYSSLDLTPEEFLALINSNSQEGPPTKQTYRLLKGFEFLKRWMKFDAQSGIFHRSDGFFFEKLQIELSELQSLLSNSVNDASEQKLQWQRDLEKDIELAILLNFNMVDATDDTKQLWAEKIEQHFNSFSSGLIAYSDLPHEILRQRCLEEDWAYLGTLISKLTPQQRDLWIQFTINDFINDVLNNSPLLIHKSDVVYGRWCFGDTYKPWQSLFIRTLEGLKIEQKISVLSQHALFPRLPKSIPNADASPFWREHEAWWNSLFLDLRTTGDFNKSLLPKWTIAARQKCSASELLSDIDDSIGYLRGQLNKSGTSEAQSQALQKQLKILLGFMDSENPEKSIKQRLLLMRASQIPLADEGLNYLKSSKTIEWYSPLRELSKHQYVKFAAPYRQFSEMEQSLEVFYTRFSKAVADFCLSRLRLHKGEKAIDGKYKSAQCTEPSQIWRQGYLKALLEIGLDLNGEVHKTVNFVKDCDPDPDVREIAKEVYKSVRRQSSSPKTSVDLTRGIIAAEWWLLLCQRQELELEVDHAAALNTRRKLLRNP